MLSGAITALPLLSIPVSEDWNRPADPPGDHLVSRPITKFNGQPSLPVSQATETCCGQNCGLQRKKWVFCTAREKVVHTQTSFPCVWSGVSHHTNDNMYMLRLTGAWPGPNSASPDWTTVRTDGLLTGCIVTRLDQCLERQ